MSANILLRQSAKRNLTTRCLATHAPLAEKDCSSITPPYSALQNKLSHVRKLLDNRPLTLAEKILYSHLSNPERTVSSGGLKRGETYLLLNPQVSIYLVAAPEQLIQNRPSSASQCRMPVHSTSRSFTHNCSSINVKTLCRMAL